MGGTREYTLSGRSAAQKQRGAVTLEMALSVGLYFLLLFGLIDLSLLFARWSALASVTSQAVRDAGVSMAVYQGSSSCSTLESNLAADMESDVRQLPGLQSATVSAELQSPTDTPYWRLKLSSRSPSGCIAFCHVLLLPSEVAITRYALIENRGFGC